MQAQHKEEARQGTDRERERETRRGAEPEEDMQRRPDLTCWRLDGREMEAQSSWWDADAPAAGREGGGGTELLAPKDALVRS